MSPTSTNATFARMEIHVHGEPVPQDRRTRPMKTSAGKHYVGTYLLPKVKEWRATILAAARRTPGYPAEPWEGPVRVSIDAYFARPQRLDRKSSPASRIRKNTKPDADNLVKSILDALTPPRSKTENEEIRRAGRSGYLWLDDGQVHLGPVDRWYVAKGCDPGIIVTIDPIAESADDTLHVAAEMEARS